MARDDWYERLEAYLDGELDRIAATAFEAETAADPALQAELTERRAWRETARRALHDRLPLDLAAVARTLERRSDRATDRPAAGRRRRGWRILALAASISLVLLIPPLLRNDPGAEGPRSMITRAGQVAAIRFGEIPGETVILATGYFDLTSDNVD